MKKILTMILALSATGLASAQEPAKSAGLDVNDVAVLFPIDATKKLFPSITLDNQGLLVSESVFNDAIAKGIELGSKLPTGVASFTKLGDYHVTGFRYDPCAPHDHMAPGVSDCLPEIRLIAQPLDNVGPSDTALHLIYSLGDQEPKPGDEAISELFKAKVKAEEILKMSSSGLPLNVHPLLAAAAKTSNNEVADLYASIVRKFAKPEKLKKLTMMGLGGQSHWIFFGGNIINGKWTPEDVPNLSNNDKAFVELNLNSREVFNPAPQNIGTSTFGFFRRETLLAGQIEELRTEIHRMENPAVTNRNNSDCLSCHSATSLHTNGSAMVPVYVEGVTANAPKGITAYPAQGLLQRHRLHWNLRAFGYFSTLPTLSMHTVNEAGLSAAKVNEILSRVNPGRDCSAVQQEVVSCYFKAVQGIGPDGPIDNSAKCQDSCQAAPQGLALLPHADGPNGPDTATEVVEEKPSTEVRPVYTDPRLGSLLLIVNSCWFKKAVAKSRETATAAAGQ